MNLDHTHPPPRCKAAQSNPLTPAATRRIRFAAAAIAIAAPLLTHAGPSLGQPYGTTALAAAQALAAGTLLAVSLPRHRWLGPALAAALLAALALGTRHAPATGRLAMDGTAHALLYAALLAIFASSMRPGRTSLVTIVASRVNPGFHAGMVPYTRAVNAAWCTLFAAELATSALLLATASPLWPRFVVLWHPLPLILLAIAESLIRRRRWRHDNPTSLRDTILGVRRLMAQRANASTIR